jgi:RNA polymerase sigma-70 factor (ECF subfamily)
MAQGEDVGDRELCRRVAEGDRSAFGTLYDRHAPAVRALVLALGAASDSAADHVHEAFARALRALDMGREPERFDLWIRRIALNVVRDSLRLAYRRYERATDPTAVPDVVDGAPDADLAIVVRRLLRDLDRPLREVVALHFYQGLRVEEVARVVGVPTGTVKSRLSRAYRRLGAALSGGVSGGVRGRRRRDSPQTPSQACAGGRSLEKGEVRP